MKIVGVFLLVLVASASAWPFSLFGDEEKKDEKSDVILNYDAGDHKHIQTGKPGEKVHGIFSVKEENGKVRTTSYRADKEGFKAEINEEDSSKHTEKEAEEKKPVDEKVVKEEKKEEEKKDSLKKDEDKVKIGEKVKEEKDKEWEKDEEKNKLSEKIKEENKDKWEKEKEKVEKDSTKKKDEKDWIKKDEEKIEKDSNKKKDDKDWIKKDEEKVEKDSTKKKDDKDWIKKDEEKNKVGEKIKEDEKETNKKDDEEDSDKKDAVKKGEFEELVSDKDIKGPLLGLISAALRDEFKRSSHKPKHHVNVNPHGYYPHAQYVPVSPYAAPYHGVRHRRAFFAPAYYPY